MFLNTILNQADVGESEILCELDQLCNPSPWKSSHFQAAIASEHSEVWVLRVENQIIALIVWQQVCDEMELHLIDTHPDYRRRGLAVRLMDKMFERAAQNGVQRIFLEVRQDNLAAQTLYRRYGFADLAVRQHYYGHGEHAVMMEKRC